MQSITDALASGQYDHQSLLKQVAGFKSALLEVDLAPTDTQLAITQGTPLRAQPRNATRQPSSCGTQRSSHPSRSFT